MKTGLAFDNEIKLPKLSKSVKVVVFMALVEIDSFERLQSVAEKVGLGEWDIDPATGAVAGDKSMAKMANWPSNPLAFNEWLATVLPLDRPAFEHAYRVAVESAGQLDIEYRLAGQPASALRIKGRFLQNEPNSTGRLHGIAIPAKPRDDGHFRRIVENSHEGVWMVDKSGKTVYANAELARMLRCDQEYLRGRSAYDFIFPEDLPKADAERERRNASNEGQRMEFRYRRLDGSELWARVSSSVVQNQNGEELILALFADMTAEKAVSREREILSIDLGRKRELLARLIDALPVMLTIYDPDFGQMQINREFTRLMGWTQEEVDTIDLISATFPDPVDRASVREYMASLAPGWKDFRMTAKSGETVDSCWANFRLSDDRLVGIGIDLRDRLAVERSYRESEARLKLALDSMELGTYDYDLRTGVVTWSERTRTIFGIGPESPVDAGTIWKAVPPEDGALLRAVAAEAMARGPGTEGTSRYSAEHRVKGIETGVERWVATWGRVLFDSDARPICLTGVNLDITAQKHAERALAESRHRQELRTEIVSRLLGTQDPQNIIDDLVRNVMEKTESDAFFNFLFDRRKEKLHLNAHAGISASTASRAEWLHLGQAVCGLVAQSGNWSIREHLQDSDDDTAALLRAEALSSYICFPLFGGGELLGTLGFGSRRKDSYSPEDQDLLGDVAAYFAIALTRMQDRAALLESEERYRIIARNIPNGGVWVVNPDMRVVAAEGPLAVRFGTSETAIGGKSLAPKLDEQLRSEAIAGFAKALSGESQTGETEFGDSTFWSQFVPIRDSHGNVAAAMALVLDITERKKADNTLRESERRERDRAVELQAIMDAVPAATWVARDPDCLHVTANRFGYDILRLQPGMNASRTPPPGEPLLPFIVLQRGKEVAPEDLPIQRAAKSGVPVYDCELEIRFSDGTARHIFGNAVPLLNADNQPTGAVGAFIDLTERKRVEEHLRQSQKLESIGVLAGGVAHDFNNLLTGVLGNASLALLDAPPKIAERLMLISDAAEKAAGLTRQLLAYAGKGQFLVLDVDLATAVRNSVELIALSIPKNIELDMSCLPRHLPAVRVDPAQLQQVVMNLVLNAAEAIGPTRPGRIALAAVAMDLGGKRFIRFEVSDTGEGIPDDLLERVFDPFFTTKFAGRGLGLAAVQGIIRSLEGVIRVRSTLAVGTTFSIDFPTVAGAAQERLGGRSAGASAGKSATVLVVDDEAMIREIATMALEQFGYSVLTAANGKLALEILNGHPEVKVVLLDVIMPVMGGIDTLLQIRQLWPKLDVLLTSGFDREETRRIGKLVEDLPFIQKPFSIQQLAAAVGAALK